MRSRTSPTGRIGYEGNHQAHQLILGNTDTFANLGTTNSAITADSLRYINAACATCQSVGTGLSMTVSNGFGNYAAGSAKLEKRFSRGLQFLTAYTWAHSISGPNDIGGQVGGGFYIGAPQDIYNARADRAAGLPRSRVDGAAQHFEPGLVVAAVLPGDAHLVGAEPLLAHLGRRRRHRRLGNRGQQQ